MKEWSKGRGSDGGAEEHKSGRDGESTRMKGLDGSVDRDTEAR